MKRELTLIPKIKIHPSKIITFNEIHWSPAPPSRNKSYNSESSFIQVEVDGKIELKQVSNAFLNSSRQGNGILSKQATKRLKLAIEYLLLLNRPQNGKTGNTGRHYNKKITFITLTLPSKQIHTDNEIKAKCLNQFLIEISKYNYVSNYVWRAEYQKNGNIHFHILVNKYVCWRDLRYRWNRIINKLGYVDRYQESMKEWHKDGFKIRTELLAKWDEKAQLKAYKEGLKTDWKSPNSTDIHSIQNITNIKAYLTKYLTKTEQQKSQEHLEEQPTKKEIGRTWGASVIISNIKGAITEIDQNIENHLKHIEKHFPENIFKTDYFTVIDIDIKMLERMKLNALTDLFHKYLLNQFNYSHQFSTPLPGL